MSIKVAGYSRIQKKYPEYAYSMLLNILKIQKAGDLYTPAASFDIITTDISDNIFLNAAFAAKAHYIITGNHSDFVMCYFEGSRIEGPKLFCDLYDQQQL